MRKLIILPGVCDTLGGTLITLSLLIKGLEECNAAERFCVLVRSGSIMENYLQQAGQGAYLQLISAKSKPEFLRHALQWVNQQPKDYPLLLDNCVERALLPTLLLAAPFLRLSGRPVYHFCHDLALSYNHLGYWLRKITFTCLAPQAMCNSRFTAGHIQRLMPNIRGILYQPVDTQRFNNQVSSTSPAPLQPILKSGAKLILTPSRISQPGMVNDKNLRALIPVLAHLKANGHFYHSVIVGEDPSPGQINTQALLEAAENAGVADCLTILPPTFAIEDYYKHASVVVTLAPREPFGRTVVEAIACGVPVIGSTTGGIGEILNHFAPEWMVDSTDPKATAQTIVRVSTDPNTSKLLLKGSNWVESECSIINYAQKMIEITGLAVPNQTNLLSVMSI
ncbi:MAG: glycosyltransferase family 4 protein [Scytonema sp. RU_4_4]|nr:glycosyltransferase family 4 protein [Scytonema sp. RU_4_4]